MNTSEPRPTISVVSAQSTLRVAVARALGEALILGLDNAADEGRPLTQLQQIDVAIMHVMAYSAAQEYCDSLETESRLFHTADAS